ncbi:MAG TPA: malectin domain-containing carbohydrate-binding protein [Bryobacteraceae bacterium]
MLYSTPKVNSLSGTPSVSKVEEQRAVLRTVLDSATFTRNPRLAALLEYLCLRCFQGEASSIKEYNIATDVFRRPADFDQSTDAIVRVEMHRLRKKLKEYYAGEGAGQPVEIVIQSGQYQPEFVNRPKDEKPPVEAVVPVPEFSAAWTPLPAVQPPPRRLPVSRPVFGFIIAVTGLLLVLALAGLAFYGLRRASQPPAASALHHPSSAVPAVIPAGSGIRLLCGSPEAGGRDRDGNVWSADAFFSGGTATEAPGQLVYRTRDPFLFRRMRSGEFSYKIPLNPGIYELRLYFADTSYSPGPAMEGGENVRMFDVLLNGSMLLQQFDVIADAGPNTADVRVFKDIRPAADGFLHLAFVKGYDTPFLNAIEIVPGIPHRMHPTRIVTQDAIVTDRSGVAWSPDDYFLGGRGMARQGTIEGQFDPQIYGCERYGNFSYAIPVADGRYTLRLYFAESYWGPKARGGGGIGSRVFDVYCNGTALLRNFDMYKEAGLHRQIVKTFQGLEPNGQGKLLLSFVPLKNYANISAIEVLPEDR